MSYLCSLLRATLKGLDSKHLRLYSPLDSMLLLSSQLWLKAAVDIAHKQIQDLHSSKALRKFVGVRLGLRLQLHQKEGNDGTWRTLGPDELGYQCTKGSRQNSSALKQSSISAKGWSQNCPRVNCLVCFISLAYCGQYQALGYNEEQSRLCPC